jgi:hypothetical protein
MAEKICFICNKKGHIASNCKLMESDHEEEEEQETATAKKKKGKAMNVTEESKKKRVVEVDSDANTEESDENDDAYLTDVCGVTRGKTRTVYVRMSNDSDGTLSSGKLVELVLDSGA